MIEHTGSGDPARTLALLWRTQERTSRRGKPDLSVDRIVQAGIALADADGLKALSMRRVAESLGVGTMSLYTYVPGKGELIDVMVDTVQAATGREVVEGWREHLTYVARENLALYRRHPWLLQVAPSRTVLGPQVAAKYDFELRGLDGIGLSDVEMDSVLNLVLGHVQNSARGLTAAAVTEKETGLTDQQWWDAAVPFLMTVFDAARYPVASRVGNAVGEAHQSAFSPEHSFEFGLTMILDGIAQLIATRSHPAC
ncbi:TetR/AcrR family transcriptional regulator [Lentzea nigeriaca]|uniref:TetR/AcrR family transcriptional regulator n=1 Tax=Lentzea nigeriaca TaxID=1128665 RepID=UPI00195E5211|nr:TetR/AcrR family transcriptional regulator C-terminal domain-containing protein [Lentzea nigeriaca]MBM7862495.1 AcrR family transcriptional regulator [Lentzea nigeriaca]